MCEIDVNNTASFSDSVADTVRDSTPSLTSQRALISAARSVSGVIPTLHPYKPARACRRLSSKGDEPFTRFS